MLKGKIIFKKRHAVIDEKKLKKDYKKLFEKLKKEKENSYIYNGKFIDKYF